MKYLIHYLTLFTIVFLFMVGCSDTKDNLTQPGTIEVHGEGALNPSSNNFHGYYLQDSSFDDCASCHAADFTGGTAEVSCTDCHETIDVHMENVWHANYIASIKFSTNALPVTVKDLPVETRRQAVLAATQVSGYIKMEFYYPVMKTSTVLL